MALTVLQLDRGGLPLVVVLAALACRATLLPRPSDSQYLFTENAIDVGEGIELYIAVDPGEPRGDLDVPEMAIRGR